MSQQDWPVVATLRRPELCRFGPVSTTACTMWITPGDDTKTDGLQSLGSQSEFCTDRQISMNRPFSARATSTCHILPGRFLRHVQQPTFARAGATTVMECARRFRWPASVPTGGRPQNARRTGPLVRTSSAACTTRRLNTGTGCWWSDRCARTGSQPTSAAACAHQYMTKSALPGTDGRGT